MVPEGWQASQLGALITHTKGYAFKSSSYSCHGVRIIRISDTSGLSIGDADPIYYGASDIDDLKKYRLSKNDIIVNTVGSRPHLRDSMVGRVIRIGESHAGAFLNQNMVKIRPNSKVHSDFLFYILDNNRFLDFITRIVRGNANQVSITLSDLFAFPVALPSRSEQQKIAEVLSTWDQAIETTEKLIANSERQKKALMQQLLTGKKRLPGFSGEWETTSLENVCTLWKGKQKGRAQLQDEGRFAVINGGISPSGYTNVSNAPENTITISEGGNSCGHVAFQTEPFWCGGHCYALLNCKINTEFLFHQLKFLERKIMRLRVGSGLPNIQKGDLRHLKLFWPTEEEQKAIGQILATTESEQSQLYKKLEHLRQEKSALMQQLLTGKRRVKIDEEVTA